MKTYFIAVIGWLFIESCTHCTTCTRNDLEAGCIKPNDTLVFHQDDGWTAYVHRYYSGGDSATCIYIYGSFEEMEQKLINDGYGCSVYALGHQSKWRSCDYSDQAYYDRQVKEHNGYTCK